MLNKLYSCEEFKMGVILILIEFIVTSTFLIHAMKATILDFIAVIIGR